MKAIKVFTIILVYFTLVFMTKVENEVLVLNDANFEEELDKYEMLLVHFY